MIDWCGILAWTKAIRHVGRNQGVIIAEVLHTKSWAARNGFCPKTPVVIPQMCSKFPLPSGSSWESQVNVRLARSPLPFEACRVTMNDQNSGRNGEKEMWNDVSKKGTFEHKLLYFELRYWHQGLSPPTTSQFSKMIWTEEVKMEKWVFWDC